MSKIGWRSPVCSVLILCVCFHSICPQSLVAYPNFIIENYEELPDSYEYYGEYGYMLEAYDRAVEIEEALEENCGIFSKWGKKLKRWFKNTVRGMCMKFLQIQPSSDPEVCAYNVAKLKRHIDSVYKTDDVSVLLDNFQNELPSNCKGASSFKARVRYYVENKDARPYGGDVNRYDQHVNLTVHDDLKDTDSAYIFGYLEIACGALISVLPFPGCKVLGRLLITNGVYRIGYKKYEEMDEENKK